MAGWGLLADRAGDLRKLWSGPHIAGCQNSEPTVSAAIGVGCGIHLFHGSFGISLRISAGSIDRPLFLFFLLSGASDDAYHDMSGALWTPLLGLPYIQ